MKSVERGVELLDERLPGWRNVIDQEKLDMGDCKQCILGQLFGDYERGLILLGVSPSQFGFHTAGRATFDSMKGAWTYALNREWMNL